MDRGRKKRGALVRNRAITAVVMMVASLEALRASDRPSDPTAEDFFEREIRPVLIARCVGCHGGSKQEGGLRLDQRAGLLKGGDSGPAFDPAEPANSLILQAIQRTGDFEMPPDGPLSERELAALTQWLRAGAVWPERNERLVSPEELKSKQHWAFLPVTRPPVPEVPATHQSWVRTPVDAFVLTKLAEQQLQPSPPADPRTLLRRLSQTITGLPATYEQVAAFSRDGDATAVGAVIDQLLDSPQYGEHWARHWLDVARYSDTKGYVYAREERFWTHAWTYRDWVVRAFNGNLPYDRFLVLQIAADQVPDRQPDDLAAMGYLTLGRRFLGVPHDIIDDRIDVVSRGMMGLTTGCARCHDHKYDPIPTADYYSLYGVFDSSEEALVPLQDTTQLAQSSPEFLAGYNERLQKLEEKRQASRNEIAERVRSRLGDYLWAQTELEKYPPPGFDQVFEKDDLLPAIVRRWERYLEETQRRQDPVFTVWHAYAGLKSDEFAVRAAEIHGALQQRDSEVPPAIAQAFATPPATFREVVDRYAAVLNDVHHRWQSQLKQAEESGQPAPQRMEDPQAEQLRAVLYGSDAPCEVPDEPVVHIESYFDSATCNELWKLQGDVDRWIINSGEAVPFALTLKDRRVPLDAHIFKWGNSQNKGELVPRQFLKFLSGAERQPFQQGSGRYELAQAIVAPTNPLTARVFVNRVWAAHFGQGLVPTTSDFGLRADPPSHPELLDWLAAEFVDSGWDIKHLQRLILKSSTFQQASFADSGEPEQLARFEAANQRDPANRWLWRGVAHRRSFEEFRDAALQASNELDLTVGGKPRSLLDVPYPKRRSLYGLIDRQFFPSALRVFDFANPDLHIPQRSETTVPQQALFFLNHPLMLERAQAVAATLPQNQTEADRIQRLFEQLLQRHPTPEELAEALRIVGDAEVLPTPVPPVTSEQWAYGYGSFDETAQRVTGFATLPHFTGTAWQGGTGWPDGQLGWVQLTADGGHPGNDRNHASVRRWTAPRTMQLEIHSQLVHEPEAGDGIRAMIVSSSRGLLGSAKVHHSSQELNVAPLDVTAGETLDFVVDIDQVLNSDQYLWGVKLTETGAMAAPAVVWDSTADFPAPPPPPRLNGWEQLVQILFCTNEYLYVD